MSKHCEMEFYFKLDQIKKLIEDNPDGKGLIIRQEIKPRKTEADGMINVIVLSAFIDNGDKDSQQATARTLTATSDSGGKVIGCPNPPGCG